MFKSASIFKIKLPLDLPALEEGLKKHQFAPCGPTQESSAGWIPPRCANGAFVEAIGGQYIIRLMIETKSVPADVLRRKVDEQVAEIERQTGRKPGKKERREIADEVKLSLLPAAFTKQSATTAWIDPKAGLLAIDTASSSRADKFLTEVVGIAKGISVDGLAPATSPVKLMSGWLHDGEATNGFTLGRACQLEACDETKAKISYTKHSVDLKEIRDHIKAGKVAIRLALYWDDRISFVLDQVGVLRSISFDDAVFESRTGGDEDGFDADVAILTGGLRMLLPDLFAALGIDSE